MFSIIHLLPLALSITTITHCAAAGIRCKICMSDAARTTKNVKNIGTVCQKYGLPQIHLLYYHEPSSHTP